MYGRTYSNGRNGRGANSNNRSSTDPPWATDYGGGTTTRDTEESGHGSNSRNEARPSYTPGSGRERRVESVNACERSEVPRSRTDSAAAGEIRYGDRPTPRPHDRDMEYYHGNHPHAATHGTLSYRESEAATRAERENAARRADRGEERGRYVSSDVPLKKNVLTVKSFDLHIPENSREHKTNDYDCTERDTNPRLVIRRGQGFIMTFTFQRPWSSKDDDFYLQFIIGEKPSVETKSLVVIKMDETNSDSYRGQGNWGARIVKSDGKSVTVLVYPAPDAIVGEWRCTVATRVTETKETFVYDGTGEIYLLFNPWCKDDQVHYTARSNDLDEYILNEYGCVFQGQADYILRKPWFYGQFRDGILDTCMTILRLAFELQVGSDMGDVITVTRKLSRMLNHSTDDPGIMMGNWSNNFSGGTSPMSWRSSSNILKEYERTKKPVKYAQCWVFSHVFTTVCRALGIPCRSLTNYESAHDTNESVTIDSYEDEDGNDLDEYKHDSIWNYHCWNDVWINRPELDSHSEKVYSGWHAVDATPQEASGGRYQCGPTPHTAIKYGELSIGLDTNFIFGEVNGEVCKWLMPKDRSKKPSLISSNPNAVGKNISTKNPDGDRADGEFGSGSRVVHGAKMDITHLYKFSEGSPEERDALKLAVGKGMGAAIFEEPGGVSIELVKISDTTIGSPFTFRAIVKNNAKMDRHLLNLTMAVFPTDYRGQRLGWDKIAFNKMEDLVIAAETSQDIKLVVTDKLYLERCDKSMSMMLKASARIKDEDKPISKMKKFVLRCPDIAVQLADKSISIKRDQPFTVTIIMHNPCSKPLTQCVLKMDGTIVPVKSTGFSNRDAVAVKKIKDIFPNQTMTINVDVQAERRPMLNKRRQLDVDLVSLELPDMSGSLEIDLS